MRILQSIMAAAMAIIAFSPAVQAREGDPMEARVFHFGDGSWARSVSQNGVWATYSRYNPENDLYSTGGHLINLDTNETWDLSVPGFTSCSAEAVSDNGVVVGMYGDGTAATNYSLGNPAFWTREKGWQMLPYPPEQYDGYTWEGGVMTGISADGHYAVGYVYAGSFFSEYAVLWELGDEPRVVDLPGAPQPSNRQSRINYISGNGKYIRFVTGVSYGSRSQLYDLELQQTASMPNTGKTVPGITINAGTLTASGNCVYGSAHGQIDGEDFEGYYLYNIANEEYTFYHADEVDNQYGLWASDNGDFFCCSPPDIPVRTLCILGDRHWVTLDEVLEQEMYTTISRLTGYADCVTGTPMGISSDGRRLALITYHTGGESYVADFQESPTELAKRVDMLKNYTVTPDRDTRTSYLQTITFTYDRALQVLSTDQMPTLTDEDGNVVRTALRAAVGTTAASIRQLTITFRTTQLENDKFYYVNVPAGLFCLEDDPRVANEALRVRYLGRELKPAQLVSSNPANEAVITELNSSVNPIALVFDTEVKVSDSAAGRLQILQGGEWVDMVNMAFVATSNGILAYPVAGQYLRVGSQYRVIIDANTVTDITGYNPNEEIILYYTGAYEDPDVFPDGTLFYEGFNDTGWVSKFMFYDGDKNLPSEHMQEYGFLDGENYPWWWVRDNTETMDHALASHSEYDPAGQSDDWCIIPQMFIPDDKCALTFLSQSISRGYDNYLQVRILVADDVYNYATDAFIQRFKDEGVIVYDKLQSPGLFSELLTDDWTENFISLADYVGKYIYIAFVNQNDDSTMVAIEDITISHDVDLSLSISTPTNVVAQASAKITGKGKASNPDVTYAGYTLTLADADGTVIDTLTSDTSITGGDTFEFAFDNELPLTIGSTTNYTITFASGQSSIVTKAYINNLAFRTHQRVVLEENTGFTCPNCPLGHVMIDRLRSAYGEQFIPIAIHAYGGGDLLASGLTAYAQVLELNAAPSAQINRSGTMYYPMVSQGSNWIFSNPDEPLWWDVVAQEFENGTVANINYGESQARYDDGTIYLPVEIQYALDAKNVNDLIFVVITEDNLFGFQQNNFSTYAAPELGEWGKGGKYGADIVTDFPFNHVARAVYGTTYWGTSGYIPATVRGGYTYSGLLQVAVPTTIEDITNCHAVTMLIDGSTRRIINAVSAPLVEASGIADTMADGMAINASYAHGQVCVSTPAEATATVYDATGAILARGAGHGNFAIDVNHSGLIIVAIQPQNGNPVVVKLIAR